MEEFRKTISGVDFSFILQEEEGESYYQVKAENYIFIMRIDENGNWAIKDNMPDWILELENELGIAIHGHDA